MSPELLDIYTRQLIEASSGDEVFFSWHGGEPLLAGTGFYREALALQEKYNRKGVHIINGIQTNGTLLDNDWCRFFADNSFVTGVSIDGPPAMHNRYRHGPGTGESSHEKALAGWKLLGRFGVTREVLCVVSDSNVSEPLEVYRYFKEAGADHITFLPLVERHNGTLTGRSVSPSAFGDFLISVFEKWKANDIGRIKVQIFEEALRAAFHQDHTICIFKKRCGGVPVVESNGDFYSCDHYVNKEYLAGNIRERSLVTLIDSDEQKKFGDAKWETLPAYCRECGVLEMCYGECPRNRFSVTPTGEPGLNYLCEGYMKFFSHCKPFIKAVAHLWRQQSPG